MLGFLQYVLKITQLRQSKFLTQVTRFLTTVNIKKTLRIKRFSR